jgi:hypothetical protein
VVVAFVKVVAPTVKVVVVAAATVPIPRNSNKSDTVDSVDLDNVSKDAQDTRQGDTSRQERKRQWQK